MLLLQIFKKKKTEWRERNLFGSVGGFNRIRRNHHYVLKQVNPNLGNGMYPSSLYSSSNPRDDSHWHYQQDKSVPDDSPALSTATPTGILKYPCPIWIRMEFTAGIYSRCLVSSWQHGTLSAPAGNDERERAGLHPVTDCRLVCAYSIFSI